MRHPVLALVVLLASPFAGARAQSTLELDEVVRATAAFHPKVRAALQKEQAAEAQLMAAQGAFDPVLDVYSAMREGGYYSLRRVDAELRLPTALWGTELWTGYRIGQGVESDRYPSYYSDETLDRGELRAGVRVPLWRDGPLDARRAGTRQAEIERGGARAGRWAVEYALRQKATQAYWKWVAAVREREIADELLTLAEARLAAVEQRAKAGAIAPVDVLEAERSVLSRRRARVSAERSAQAAALVLGLFVRDEAGDPAPPLTRVPPAALAVPPPIGDPEAAFARVRACHPLVQDAQARLEGQRVERDLADARLGPKLDLKMQISRDLGDGNDTLPGTVYEAGLVFSMPLALRTARGKLSAAEAKLAAEARALQLVTDELQADLRDAASAYRAAVEKREYVEQLAETTRRLAEAERRRFDAGATSLLVVNMREQSVGEAALSVIGAFAEQWTAAARWEALTRCEASDPPASGADPA